MALRYEINIDNAAMLRVEPDKVVPRYPAPGRVEFRPGSNMNAVVDQLLEFERVQLCAAVGAGKSVKVPEALVNHTKGLVVHCVPSRLLALNLYKYVSTVANVDTYYVDGADGPLPRKGIAFTGAADLVRRLVQSRSEEQDTVPFVLFLDECHESDCYTEALRTLGTDLPGCVNLVLSSATFDPDGGRKVESAGKRIDRVLPDTDITDWDPEDDGKPWSVTALDNDALIFVDRPSMVEKLRVSYEENGFYAFALSARMTKEKFEHVLKVLGSRNRPVVVLLADYSFRSGFTFPSVGVVIDSGEVAYYGESSGAPARMYRRAFKFEVEQAAGRGGRVAGSSCVCWSPARPEAKMCDVDGTEADAVPLLYRMLGYKSPKKYSATRFHAGLVPDDISEALRSKMPLFAWRNERLTEWVGGCVQPVRPEIICETPPAKPHSPALRPAFKMPPMADGTVRSFTPPSPQLLPTAEIRGRSRSPPSRPLSVQQPAREVKTAPEVSEPALDFDFSAARGSGRRESIVPLAVNVELPALSEGYLRDHQGRVDNRSDSAFSAHTRSVSAASVAESVESIPRVFDVGTEAHDALADLLEKMRGVKAGGLVMGDYAYMPGVDNCDDAARVYPGGSDAVHRIAKRPQVVAGLSHMEKMCALRLVLDAYNDAVSRLRAVKRLTEALPQVATTMGSLVQPDDLRVWLTGLHEKCAEDRALARAHYDDMIGLFAKGYVDPGDQVKGVFAERELSFVQGFVRQLEIMVSDHDPEGPGRYAGSVRDRPKDGGVLSAVSQRAIMPAERKGFSREMRQIEPARAKDLVRVPTSQTAVVGKYRLQPSSGLPSLVTRALLKAVGEGDVCVQVK